MAELHNLKDLLSSKNIMKVLLRISLIMLLGLLSLVAISIFQFVPTSFLPKYPNSQNIEQSDSLREECFTKVDQESLQTCKELVSQDRSDVEAWNQLGNIYYELENYQEAYLSFKYATTLQADHAIAWANICAALNQLQSYEEALNACNTSLDLSSVSESSVDERVLAWNNKAIVLYFLGRYREALDAFDETLAIEPENLEARLDRIFVLHALSHQKDAKDDEYIL